MRWCETMWTIVKPLWSIKVGLSSCQNWYLRKGLIAINLPNGAHHSELSHGGEETEEVRQVHQQILAIVGQWLEEIRRPEMLRIIAWAEMVWFTLFKGQNWSTKGSFWWWVIHLLGYNLDFDRKVMCWIFSGMIRRKMRTVGQQIQEVLPRL